jgi:hypothetical protein
MTDLIKEKYGGELSAVPPTSPADWFAILNRLYGEAYDKIYDYKTKEL